MGSGGSPAVVVGLIGNAAAVYGELVEGGVVPDVVTDLTAAHDAVFGYCPVDYSLEQWRAMRQKDPSGVADKAPAIDGAPGRGDGQASRQAAPSCSRTGTTCACRPRRRGPKTPSQSTGFAERYLRPLFCQGIGPFRWIALSGEPSDLAELDQARRRDVLPTRGGVLDIACQRACGDPGSARPQLLARPRGALQVRRGGERAGRRWPSYRRRSPSPGTISTPGG